MSTCQNGGYELVLLSSRPKYKCALCSRLYPQIKVENKTFREWNKKQRELDLHNLDLEIKPRIVRPKLSEEERKIRAKEYRKEYFEKNKEKEKIIKEKYYLKTRDKHLESFRKYYLKNKEVLLGKRKEERANNLEGFKRNQRVSWWRRKQRDLALTLERC